MVEETILSMVLLIKTWFFWTEGIKKVIIKVSTTRPDKTKKTFFIIAMLWWNQKIIPC
jgi:hypothetical protein